MFVAMEHDKRVEVCSSLIGWRGCVEGPLHHMIVVAVDVGRPVSNPQIWGFCLSTPAACIVVSVRGDRHMQCPLTHKNKL